MACAVLRAGDLDRRVTILRAGAVDDGTATVTGAFAPVGTRWAKKTDASDGERMRAAQLGQVLTTRFVVRWDALTATVSGLDRLECEGRAYAIVGVKEWGGRRIGVEITANAELETAP